MLWGSIKLIIVLIIISICTFYGISIYNTYDRIREPNYRLQSKRKNNDHIRTVFFQGHGASRAQGAKYFGKDGIRVINNEHTGYDRILHYQMNQAHQLLYNAYTYAELTDVSYGFSLNPLHFVLETINILKHLFMGITMSPDRAPHHQIISNDNIAGYKDIRQLDTAIKSCIGDFNREDGDYAGHGPYKIVVFGYSRGASTVFSTIARMKKEYHKDISLVIMEAPFNTVKEAIIARYGKLEPIVSYILEEFTEYDGDQVSPMSLIPDFPNDIPVAFITSKVDTTVPSYLTETLIDGLRKNGHKHVHHLMLETSSHSFMPLGNTEDQKKYKNFVENLYDKYC